MNYKRYRRTNEPRQTTLHHICGHSTENFTLDCFSTGKIKQLEAGPCANCFKRTTKAPVMSLCLGNMIDGRFVEDKSLDITADSCVLFLIGTGGDEIVLTFPKLYPHSIASRVEVESAVTYTVLYQALS